MKAKANNMLPIKYRVWDKDRKKMNYPGWELEDKNRANDLDLDEMTTG
jgi:hypothetical protein